MPQTKVRVVGSGFTTFNYMGKPLMFLDRLADGGVRPVGTGYEYIQPIGSRHPTEIATARAVTGGLLTLTVRELWNEPVWWQLGNLRGTWDLLTVYDRLAQDPSYVTCQMLIKPPTGPVRGKTYHNCVIVDIPDDEDVTIGALSVSRGITVAYTHSRPLGAAA